MADPLSTVASVLAVLNLAVAATKYVKDVKQSLTDRLRLRDELRSTTCLLEMLKDRLEDSEETVDGRSETLKPSSIASLAGEDGPLALFKRVLEDIITKLAPQNKLRRLAQPFTWPFNKKDVNDFVSTLERLKSHFNLVMQKDLVALAKLSNLKLDGIYQQFETARTKSLDKESEEIVLWISPLSYRSRQLDILENMQSGTGNWFLDHSIFRRWVDGEVDVVWCPGIPGAGKTILTSLAVDYLERQHDSAEAICTYVYCDHNKRAEQTPVALLSSLLQQILQHSATSVLPAEVLSLYQVHKKHGTRPTFTQITDLLRALVAKFKTFRVVVDALDECAESDLGSLRFISAVQSLGPSVKLLCTSRFSTVFENYFVGAEKLEITAKSDDIRIFLDAQIEQQPGLARHVRSDPSLKGDIIAGIIEETHGMFLLARLHLDSLSNKISRKAVRAALITLPTSLDATYAEAVQRIYGQAPDLVEVAEVILFWVICAKRPLSVVEIRHAYAMRELPSRVRLEEDDLPDGEMLTSTCGGLILVDGESQTLRVVHYTAEEYFERPHALDLAAARRSLANVSLTYLTLPNFSDGPCSDDLEMDRRLQKYPFLDYASKHWGEDIGKLSTLEIDNLRPLLEAFLSNHAAMEVAAQVQHLPRTRHHGSSQDYPKNDPPLVHVSRFDMPQILWWLITAQGHHTESRGNDRVTALIRAADCGLINNVRVLIAQGADLEAHDLDYETALCKAVQKGAKSVIRALIKAGADVNVRPLGWTTLMSAVSAGNLELAKDLVQAGADVSPETMWGGSALSIALYNGQETIATFLIDQGAALPRNEAGRRAAVVACRKGLRQLVRLLIKSSLATIGSLGDQSVGGHSRAAGMPRHHNNEKSGDPQAEPFGESEELEDIMNALGDSTNNTKCAEVSSVSAIHGNSPFAAVDRFFNGTAPAGRFVQHLKFLRWSRSSRLLSLHYEITFVRNFRLGLLMTKLFADLMPDGLRNFPRLSTQAKRQILFVELGKSSKRELRALYRLWLLAYELLAWYNERKIHGDIKPANILIYNSKSSTSASQDLVRLSKSLSTRISGTARCGNEGRQDNTF